MKLVRVASGSSWSRDRLEPAADLIARGNIDYLCFDTMSEVTQSVAQVARMDDPSIPPYDPYLRMRLQPILKDAVEKKVKIITNAGWMDPMAAADEILRIAEELKIASIRIGIVSGSDVTPRISDMGLRLVENGVPVAEVGSNIVSAEVYLGGEGIIEALRAGADVIITSRVGDACPYMAALAYEFGWSIDDHHNIAKGMIIGHLLECGAQVTGGCFADPPFKNVPNIADLSNPIAEVTAESVVITKLPDTGGLVSEATCKEQLLYEVQDPANYLCPDVIADLTKVRFRQQAPDRVEVLINEAGKPKTPTLKALVGLREGFIAEELVLFAGPGALQRAELTKDLLFERLQRAGVRPMEIRADFVGLNSVHREASPAMTSEPYEVVLRVALKTETREEARKLGMEVDPLAVNGMSGTGKWGTLTPGSRIRAVVGLQSVLVPREEVPFHLAVRHNATAERLGTA